MWVYENSYRGLRVPERKEAQNSICYNELKHLIENSSKACFKYAQIYMAK